MPIARKIRLGGATCCFDQTAHSLDQRKIDFRNFVRAQPIMHRASLQRQRQNAQLLHFQFRQRRRQQFVKKTFLFGGNRGRTPDARANVAAKRFFQIRNNVVTDAIAQRRTVAV